MSKIRQSVQELWIFEVWVNPYYGGSLSWQLRHNLWCHRGELSIGFVQRISYFFQFKEKLNFFWLPFWVWDGYIKSVNISDTMMLIHDLRFHINEILWKIMYKTYGEFSTLTSQIVVELPTQRSPIIRIYWNFKKS